MPKRAEAGRSSETATRDTRGLERKLMVVSSSSMDGALVGLSSPSTNRCSISFDCRAHGGSRTCTNVTNGAVVYATKNNGTIAHAVAGGLGGDCC